MGDYGEGESEAREALRLLGMAGETKSILFAAAEGALADALRGEGNYIDETRVAEHAVSLAKQTSNPIAPRLAILLTILARAREDSGQVRRAVELYKQAVDIFRRAGEGNRIELGSAYANLALAYFLGGKPKNAFANVDLALAAWKDVLPPDHVFMLYVWNTEIVSYVKSKAYRRAETLIPKMLAVSASQLGPNHPDRVTLLGNAASVYVDERKYEQAEAPLKEALELGERVLPRGHPALRNILRTYAFVLERSNRVEEASRLRSESQVILASSMHSGR